MVGRAVPCPPHDGGATSLPLPPTAGRDFPKKEASPIGPLNPLTCPSGHPLPPPARERDGERRHLGSWGGLPALPPNTDASPKKARAGASFFFVLLFQFGGGGGADAGPGGLIAADGVHQINEREEHGDDDAADDDGQEDDHDGFQEGSH